MGFGVGDGVDDGGVGDGGVWAGPPEDDGKFPEPELKTPFKWLEVHAQRVKSKDTLKFKPICLLFENIRVSPREKLRLISTDIWWSSYTDAIKIDKWNARSWASIHT